MFRSLCTINYKGLCINDNIEDIDEFISIDKDVNTQQLLIEKQNSLNVKKNLIFRTRKNIFDKIQLLKLNTPSKITLENLNFAVILNFTDYKLH